MTAPVIRCEGVSKRFGRHVAVDGVDLAVAQGEFFALLGPSGCGKTTLLRMIAGLEIPDSGKIWIDGADMSQVPPNRRPANMVFQSYAVFPHMSVAENVGYGLAVEGVAASERARRVEEALALVQLEGFGGRKPEQLSGGQRQRVALARALIKRPKVLLLDEPLSALDAKLREQMRGELAQLQRKVGISFVFVTHDQQEALVLAGRCAVMKDGRLEQAGGPAELYERPANRFVADFIGQVNLFEAMARLQDGRVVVAVPDLGAAFDAGADLASAVPGRVWAALRPEKLALHREAPPAGPAAAGTVVQVAYLGSESLIELRLSGGKRIKVRHRNDMEKPLTAGEPAWVSWSAPPRFLLS